MLHSNVGRSLVVAAALAVASCASPGDASKLAQAGADFGGAMIGLLDTSKRTMVRASSERVIDRGTNATLRQRAFDTSEREIGGLLASMSRLQKSSALLQQYFLKLQELATSDTIEETRAAIEGVAKAFFESVNVKPSDIKVGPATGDAILRGVTTVFVGAAQRAAINRELNERGSAIALGIERMAELLRAIKIDLGDDVASINRLAYDREVKEPFLRGSVQPKDFNAWIQTRAKYKLEPLAIGAELTRAEQAGALLAAEWKKISEKRDLSPASLHQIIQIVAEMKSFIAAFK